MHQPDATPDYRKGISTTLAIAVPAGATVVALTLPVANAEPDAAASTSTAAGQHGPERPAALRPPAPPPPVDPNAPPPPADPNAPPSAG